MFRFLTTTTILFVVTNSQSAPYTNGEVETMRGYFEANIDYPGAYTGCVVASPDSTNPDYLYHWQRDAGVSMHTLQYTAPNSSTFDQRFQDYVTWVLHVQTLNDPNGINILGEPKFNTDGSVYTGGWCRPQNDGPASRAIALTDYAFWLISQNRTDYVKEYLYTPSSEKEKKELLKQKYNNNYGKLTSCTSIPDAAKVDCGYPGITQAECEGKSCCWVEINPNPNNYPWCFYPNSTIPTAQPTMGPPSGTDAIPTDLNYVSANWQESDNCDLWEEVRGPQFYTYMVQRHALIYGASLASYFGDDTVASSWNSTASSMISSIKAFDNGSFVSETQRTLDCSIIVGSLYGGFDNLYPPTDSSILNTVAAIKTHFNNVFEINPADTSAGIPGVLIGRYADDTYDGCLSDGGSQGHAWILCTNALGDLYYRNSLELKQTLNPDLILDPKKLRIYAKHLYKDQPKGAEYLLNAADSWEKNKLTNKEKIQIKDNIASYMATEGDGQLERIKYHISDCNYHQSEQICETNGLEIGATDLTWSYGTFLSAWYYRSQAINAGVTPMPRDKPLNWLKHSNKIFNDKSNNCGGCTNQCAD